LAPSTTLIVRASLRKRLYRDIELVSASTLADLAETIVAAFGFDMDHAYGFYSKLTGNLFDSPRRVELFADIEGQPSRSVKNTRITTAFPKEGSAMTFLYDFGDEWRFRVEVVRTGSTEAGVAYPKIISSFGTAPMQYPDIDDP
jgi:hypothetical protein